MYETSQSYFQSNVNNFQLIYSSSNDLSGGRLEDITNNSVIYHSEVSEIGSPNYVLGDNITSIVGYQQGFSSKFNHYSNFSNIFNNSSLSYSNNFNQMINNYSKNNNQSNNEMMDIFPKIRENYHFIPDAFLKQGFEGGFVGKAEEVKEYVEQAFENLFNSKFPNDIKLSILSEEKFREVAPNPSTIGLSINRKRQNFISEIFILNSSLARVMLTIGHEIGHVLTESLDNDHDEEAKAYAFSLAWMKVIKENDIAGLGNSIVTDKPAKNGLHNVAFSFVQNIVDNGKNVWSIYLDLIRRDLSVNFVAS